MVEIRLYNTGDHWRARIVTESGTPLFTSRSCQASQDETLDARARGRALGEAVEHAEKHNLLGESTK